MELLKNIWVSSKKSGLWSNFSGEWKIETDPELIEICKSAKRIARNSRISTFEKEELIKNCINEYKSRMPEDEKAKINESEKMKKETTVNKLINFFKEFDFEPNFRFINTLKHHSSSVTEACTYVTNYFTLINDANVYNVSEKMKSIEFDEIIKQLQDINTTTVINHRLKLYYGSQGTGKTTIAMKETSNEVMVCHSGMLPSDLMKAFDFKDGKSTFVKTALWKAMENGTKIVLDEVNLLPLDSLRFLQSILDNKNEFEFDGYHVSIKEGFEIIGTMNLSVNGSIYELPAPLVDRAYELKEFKLTAENLASALD